ncbi:hypothetical protein BKA61DRAFT_569227 [Leptodontidium sp. MPI-SDFR-AT-0119]|nr:hypothetical protein BKA61DRAFT_569227 [Leptodontidium sp. MPI-SDFR-AT-0119]
MSDRSSKLISTPYPDMLYGYNSLGAFPQQQAQLRTMANEMVANTQDLIYPFLLSSSRPMVREGMGVSRLYVSWKRNELDYYMKHVDSFLLQKPRDYIEFRKHALNIIDWGKDERLNKIRDSLNSLLEESRKAASQRAKSRPPPFSDDSVRNSSQKRKSSSSSRGRNSKAKTVQEHPNSGANTSPSACFHEYNQDDSSVQIPAAADVYAPPPTSFQENDQYDSSMQIPDADCVYAPPSASFQDNQGWSLDANFH